MKKKIALLILMCVMSISVFIGCGSTSSDTIETDNTEPLTTTESEENNGSSDSGEVTLDVDPDFKELMDKYEEFFNEYCDFMEEYENDPSNEALISKYTEWNTEYADYMEQINNINADDLSSSDWAYYSMVMGRIYDRMEELYPDGTTTEE